jgi:phosphoribulokinase
MNDQDRADWRAPVALTPADWEETVLEMGPGEVGRPESAFIVGVLGDSGSGKSTLAASIAELLGRSRVSELWLDDYHRYTRNERAELGITAFNPRAPDLPLLFKHFRQLRAGSSIETRSYRHEDGAFGPRRTVEPREFIVARGLLGLPSREATGLYDLSVFLAPEPDLLFRWKTRRDVLFRGYKEAQVLKNIADHLLDAKQFIGPQAALADLVVEFSLPEPDAPDTEVRTTARLSGIAAMIAASEGFLEGLPISTSREPEGLRIHIPSDLPSTALDAWARHPFGSSPAVKIAGLHHDESGVVRQSQPLAFVHLLVARLIRAMARARV